MNSSNQIIIVDGLGKKYILGQHLSTNNIREAISIKLRSMIPSKKISHIDRNEFWAVRNLSFTVKPGERLGIIGKNGAGKSTTLKLLSRITEPSEGRIIIRGRMSSLLEVGTGFHPELTGKENIYLNGAILGMTRKEINSKFDEIVDFAGIEKFLSTPVKRYSSGMYVRLAFAVASHLEPDILVVDEVLAVGDIEFQKKCLGKMNDVASQGRTILFVSHNMKAIQTLCDRAIVLEKGNKIYEGGTAEAIDFYVSRSMSMSEIPLSERLDRTGNGKVVASNLVIKDNSGNEKKDLIAGEDYEIIISYKKITDEPLRFVEFDIGIYDLEDNLIFAFKSSQDDCYYELNDHEGHIGCLIHKLPLNIGTYYFAINIFRYQEVFDIIHNVNYVNVVSSVFYKNSNVALPTKLKALYNGVWCKP